MNKSQAKLDEMLGLPANVTMRAYGAYGRSYDSFDKAVFDWNAGKDFRQVRTPGMYFSVRDAAILRGNGYAEIEFLDVTHGRLGSIRL